MKTFLFWNLNNKDLSQSILSLALFYQIDILMFAEFKISSASILNILNSQIKVDEPSYYLVPSNCDKVKIFVKFNDSLVRSLLESDRLTIQRLQLPGSPEILLAVTHLVDKRNWDEDSQNAEASNISAQILNAEEKGLSRTYGDKQGLFKKASQ